MSASGKKLSSVRPRAVLTWLEREFAATNVGYSREEYVFPCPFCDPQKKHKDGYIFNIDKKVGNCWRGHSPKCDKGHNIFVLVGLYYGIDEERAESYVENNFSDNDTLKHVKRLLQQTEPIRTFDTDVETVSIDMPEEAEPIRRDGDPDVVNAYKWLTIVRRMPESVIESLGPKYMGKKVGGRWVRYRDRVFFPVTSIGSRAWLAYRVGGDPTGKRPKTLNPPGKALSKMLFLYDYYVGSKKPMLITEGIFDALRLFLYGANATCVFGTNLSDEQLALLNDSGCEEAVICLDSGTEDRVSKMAKRLQQGFLGAVKVMSLEEFEDKDPDELTFDEYERLYDARRPYKRSRTALSDIRLRLEHAKG